MHKSTFQQICIHFRTCKTSHFSQNDSVQVLWSNPCMAIETFDHWDSFLWDFGFSRFFFHSAAWKNSETDSAVSFLHVYWHRDGNFNCLLQNTARWFSIANNLQDLSTLFCLLFIDHGVSFKICVSGAKILDSSILPARVPPGATTIPSRIRVIGDSAVQQQSPLRRDPSASRNTFSVSTITDGYARQGRVLPYTWPYVGLTVHRAVSSL